mmetsp:Transcript_17904/g.29634  ORF Transcript_17904/g.29634 Transcript_17904/m.29634 type:complete len:631 (-) Transcript_17904:64-1956(-)
MEDHDDADANVNDNANANANAAVANNIELEWEEPPDAEVVIEQHDDGIPRNEDGSMDGGVAGIADGSKEPDLMLFLECSGLIPGHETNPVLAPGVKVCIGLEKSTKLGLVFDRYVDFANEHEQPPPEQQQQQRSQRSTPKRTNHHHAIHLLHPDDLEFSHCTILRATETSEVSALMKNDTIQIQASQLDQRALQQEAQLLQRESDRHYFHMLRGLMTDLTGSCDILLDCQGKLMDENGLHQEVLRTTLRGHSTVLTKRCQWLGTLVQQARDDLGRRSVVTIPDQDNDIMKDDDDDMPDAMHQQPPAESDDDGIAALPYPAEARIHQGAAQIENDDEEEAVACISRSGSPTVVLSSASRNMLWVTIPNHPIEAVKLLLEFCYTNSVISLGQKAFDAAWHSNDDENNKAVSRQWPDTTSSMRPRVSFATALAGIALAEEAKLPRLSLMCEVASSLLVESTTVVEALSMCTRQDERTGNPLPRLRKIAMTFVLRRVDQWTRTVAFEKAMRESERSAVLVPSLLVGTMEAMVAHTAKHVTTTTKEMELSHRMQESFNELDKEDMFHRDLERRKYRASRHANPHFRHDEPPVMELKKASKKSLKRSSHSAWGHSHIRKHGRKHKKRSDKYATKKH